MDELPIDAMLMFRGQLVTNAEIATIDCYCTASASNTTKEKVVRRMSRLVAAHQSATRAVAPAPTLKSN